MSQHTMPGPSTPTNDWREPSNIAAKKHGREYCRGQHSQRRSSLPEIIRSCLLPRDPTACGLPLESTNTSAFPVCTTWTASEHRGPRGKVSKSFTKTIPGVRFPETGSRNLTFCLFVLFVLLQGEHHSIPNGSSSTDGGEIRKTDAIHWSGSGYISANWRTVPRGYRERNPILSAKSDKTKQHTSLSFSAVLGGLRQIYLFDIFNNLFILPTSNLHSPFDYIIVIQSIIFYCWDHYLFSNFNDNQTLIHYSY